jgi:putative salt-induced outer membrane protein YdiY
MLGLRLAAPAFLALLTLAPPLVRPLVAQEPLPTKPETAWRAKLGFSFLHQSGNQRLSSGSFDGLYRYEHRGGKWAFEAGGQAVVAEKGKRRSGERWNSQTRFERRLGRRLRASLGARHERDRFAGIEARSGIDTSLHWQAHDSERWKLGLLAGLSRTREEPQRGLGKEIWGALLQADATGQISPTASWQSQITLLPSFEDANDLRVTSKLGVHAALTETLGLRLTCDVRYDREPVPGFATTDATTTAALVARLGKKGPD